MDWDAAPTDAAVADSVAEPAPLASEHVADITATEADFNGPPYQVEPVNSETKTQDPEEAFGTNVSNKVHEIDLEAISSKSMFNAENPELVRGQSEKVVSG